MSFLFNFEAPHSEEQDGKSAGCNGSGSNSAVNLETCPKISAQPAFEVTEFLNDDITCNVNFEMKSMNFGEHILTVVDTKSVEKKLFEQRDVFLTSNNLIEAIVSHSDLITGAYEGGLKVWECGIDLVKFLSSHPHGTSLEIKGKSILELGCGAGLPGLYCCKACAQRVDFQDYNEEVLKLLTYTNVKNNIPEAEENKLENHFYAGDWASFSELAVKENLRYDVILTAETIYNPGNYAKLHDVFKTTLKENGIILLAAKVYYFGVGGSVDSFLEYVSSLNCFSTDVVHSIAEGVPRKIIMLRRLPK
ncbi:unnamed protein product [Lymnaea stagnalis]|uniref:protein-histidine N-methyltransferase n=1 Tax=Lymnaea stagnalis TaxID=6523 RepID=A0AAV2H533_LYMST